MPTLDLSLEEVKLLNEAMTRFTRSVGGDLARERIPKFETKTKMQRTLELAEKVRSMCEEGADDEQPG